MSMRNGFIVVLSLLFTGPLATAKNQPKNFTDNQSLFEIKIPAIQQALPNQEVFFVFKNPAEYPVELVVSEETKIRHFGEPRSEGKSKVVVEPGQSVKVFSQSPEDFNLEKEVSISINNTKKTWKISTINGDL